MKRLVVILAFAAALSGAACGRGPRDGDACSGQIQICGSDGVPLYCVDGKYRRIEACGRCMDEGEELHCVSICIARDHTLCE